jgi:hypothetical protein
MLQNNLSLQHPGSGNQFQHLHAIAQIIHIDIHQQFPIVFHKQFSELVFPSTGVEH